MSDDNLNEGIPGPKDMEESVTTAEPTARTVNTVQLNVPVAPAPVLPSNVSMPMPTQIGDIDDEEPITESEQILVLQHLAMAKGLYARTADVLKEIQYFSNTTSEVIMALSGSIILYMDSYKEHLPSRQMILHMFEAYYSADCNINTRATIGNIMDDWYDGQEKILDVKFIEDRLYALLKQHRKKSMLMQGVAKSNDTFSESLTAYNKSLENNPFTTVKRTNPYGTLEGLRNAFAQNEKHPTKVWFLDQAMGDGAIYGEAIGILAPPSGGKTTVAMQLVYAQCYADNHVAHISTEQGIEGDLITRIAALVTEQHRSKFDKGIEHMSEEQQIDLLNKLEKFHMYHHFFDYTQSTPTTVDELLQPVIEMIKGGNKPKYIIIDWWGAIKDAMVVTLQESRRVSDNDIRTRSRVWLKEIISRCKAMRVIPLIFHQLSGEAAGKKGGSVIKGQNAQEDKQWENYFDFNLVFGPKDSDNNFVINPSKARRMDNTTIKANLNGGFCRIDPEEKASPFEQTQAAEHIMDSMVQDNRVNEEFM
jgi:archaellum biogenesis ATPase FlaH